MSSIPFSRSVDLNGEVNILSGLKSYSLSYRMYFLGLRKGDRKGETPSLEVTVTVRRPH